jgi:pullulanase
MDKSTYPITEKQLGAIYQSHQTTFNVWAPTHETISLAIYENPKAPFRTLYPMQKSSDGVFSVTLPGDLHGTFYTYLLEGQSEVTDPYSLSTSANGLRSAVIDLDQTNPENWIGHFRPRGNMGCDAILYEVHVKDFSGHANSGMMHKGKFLAFSENDTRIENTSTGLDHIADLGVTHVHLMPIYDYTTVDEELDADKNYNWGYDPEHFNTPEGSYATKPDDPVNRILELKTAIKALHEKGLKVVLDVVYNHTYRTEHSHFNALAPLYYHRITEEGNFSNGSGCGNEFASETPMGREFILSSLLYWVREYQVDGFRFDLMALIDKTTIKLAIEKLREIDPEILIYGEPWMGGLSTLPETERIYKGSQCDQGYSLFNDDFRDAIKGDNDSIGKGFIQGNKDMKLPMHTGLVGSIAYDAKYIGFTTHPCETINYFNSHDNLILFDKLKKSAPDATFDELVAMNKLAFNVLLTAQGTPFFHAGNEFLRDKKGHHNSYNAPLSVNAIDWQNKVKYEAFYKYVKDLIKLRKTYKCLRLKSSEAVKNSVFFIEDTEYVEAFKDGIVSIIKQDDGETFECMLIAHNPGKDAMLLSILDLKDTILEFYESFDASTLSLESFVIECIFDEHGLLEAPQNIDPLTQHLVRVNPISSKIFKLSRKSYK